ncbi:MAG: signal peptidase II [Oscillospiraceae bacterium]|jgi:signal peptidase II|nr:signal peptidase II [Oscillospiraceae bacterium]
MKKTKLWQRLAAVAVAAALVFLDQLFKRAAVRHLRGGTPRELLPRILQLRYTENTGVAFSFLGDSRTAMRVIAITTALIILIALGLMLAGRIRGMLPLVSVALIIAGGLGNLIDRVSPQHFVVDYLEFLFVRFAVFNFADICITCGVITMAAYILFIEPRMKKKTGLSDAGT